MSHAGTVALSVLGADTSDAGEAGLTYSWSVESSPGGVSAARFSDNDSNDAKNATAHFNNAGLYVLTCTITNGDNNTASASVSIDIKQTKTALRLTPADQHIRAGKSLRYTAAIIDQFKNAMPTTAAPTYSVISGSGSIDRKGLFTAGNKKGHAVIKATLAGISVTVGATII